MLIPNILKKCSNHKKSGKSILKRILEMISEKCFRRFSYSIWLVALFGLFLSTSTQMLYSHLALYLTYDLKTSLASLAAIDGSVEFLSYFVRVFSGAISDYLYDRKLLLVIGCSIAMVVKPLFSFANSFITVAIGEVAERLGSGIQASPRDALIADLSHSQKLGSSFGFCKAMKTTGGVLGASLAVFIVYLSKNNYKLLFLISTIPAFLALLCILKIKTTTSQNSFSPHLSSNFVKTDASKIPKFDNPFRKKYLKSLDSKFWYLIFVAFLCELSHFGESLLTIRASQLFSQTFSGITSIFAACGQVIFSYFMGLASDNTSKFTLLRINILLLLIAYSLMNYATSIAIFWCGIFTFYGQFAVMQLLFLALITRNVNKKLRGTAVGIFYSFIGGAYMATTYVCGTFCKDFGYQSAFMYVSSVAVLAFVALCSVKKEKYEQQ